MIELIKTNIETTLDVQNICFYNIKQYPLKYTVFTNR